MMITPVLPALPVKIITGKPERTGRKIYPLLAAIVGAGHKKTALFGGCFEVPTRVELVWELLQSSA
jgi:hypothetical protein